MMSAESPLILVIEDEPSIRDVLAAALQSDGYRVAAAANGLQGLDALRELRPSAVLLDLEMPDVDGWQFLSCYQELTGERLPILVLSANLSSTDLRRLRSFGVDDWSDKPFDLDQLLADLREMAGSTYPTPISSRLRDKRRWAHLRQLTARVVRQLDASHARLIQAEDTLGWSQARIMDYYRTLGVPLHQPLDSGEATSDLTGDERA